LARIVACRHCRVEFEAVTLGGGRALIVCVGCETMGFHDELPFGAPHWPADLGEERRGRKRSTPKRAKAPRPDF